MLESFLKYLLYTRRLSENTVIRYKKGLKKFESYLNKNWKTLDKPEDIKLYDIYSYVAEIGANGYAPASCNNDINWIRAYLRYCSDILEINVVDTKKIYWCKVPDREIWFFNKEQKKLIISAVNKGIWKGEIVRLRNKLLTYMLFQTWLRCHEIAKIKVDDIKENLQVVGKWWKLRTVYLREDILCMIREYLSKRKRKSDYLFDSTKAWKHFREWSIRKLYMKISEKVWFHVHAHKIRHTFCTDLLHIPWSNIYNVAKLMWHSKITTTQIYLGVEDNELKKLQFWLKF